MDIDIFEPLFVILQKLLIYGIFIYIGFIILSIVVLVIYREIAFESFCENKNSRDKKISRFLSVSIPIFIFAIGFVIFVAIRF